MGNGLEKQGTQKVFRVQSGDRAGNKPLVKQGCDLTLLAGWHWSSRSLYRGSRRPGLDTNHWWQWVVGGTGTRSTGFELGIWTAETDSGAGEAQALNELVHTNTESGAEQGTDERRAR